MRRWNGYGGALVIGSALLAGCVTPWSHSASLPWPERPDLKWTKAMQSDEEMVGFCLDLDEARRYARWLDQLEEFQGAYERLQE